MDAIEQHEYLKALTQPVPGDSPTGASLAEDDAFDFLETEMMKLGGLHQGTIEWAKAEKEAVRLLGEQSKDLKTLAHLLMCLQHRANGTRFLLSLRLLQGFMEHWWEQAYPFPGPKGARARKMLFTQMIQRSVKAAEKVTLDAGHKDAKAYALGLVEGLQGLAESFELATDDLSDLERFFRRLPDAPKPGDPPAESTAPPAQAQSGASSTTSGSASGLSDLRLEAGNDRQIRQSLFKLADFLVETDPAEPLAYQVRRYAIWFSISATPPTRDGSKTELAPVSSDRVAEYREALTRDVDLGLWNRIEQSVSVSPFWLDGHYLSAQVAQRLGHDACAQAIGESLSRLLKRLPDLEKLTFSDGTPFMQGETRSWLAELSGSGDSGAGAGGWSAHYQEARERLRQHGLEAGLQVLETGLAEASEPRDQFYWRLLSADLLREAGLESLARRQYADLREQTRNAGLSDWEPGLLSRLDRHLDNT